MSPIRNNSNNRMYANTNKQDLAEHLFAVGYIASKIISVSVPEDEKLCESTYYGGALHDIGKVEPVYSKWVSDNLSKSFLEIPEDGEHINKQSLFEKHPRHNEISFLLFVLQARSDKINQENLERIKHAIFWHHAKPIRKADFQDAATIFSMLLKNIGENELNNLFILSSDIVDNVNSIADDYGYLNRLPDFHRTQDKVPFASLDGMKLPEYKQYSKRSSFLDYRRTILKNAKNSLIRSSVISADRIVSALKNEELSWFIKNKSLHKLVENIFSHKSNIREHIENCIKGFEARYPFNNRNVLQSEAAGKLSLSGNISVLNGPAGCGKTKIALEWAKLTNADKIVWVCPRIHVCMGLLNDLSSNDYLPGISIEINTGEFKYLIKNGKKLQIEHSEQFSGDIVITTVDQIINTITTHNHVTSLNQFMNSHVIFDEFHELINLPGINLLFMELIECKKLKGKYAHTLLVSATPHYLFVKDVLDIDCEDIMGIESFNSNPYRIQFVEYDESAHDDLNPFYSKPLKDTFVISNTATTAQISFIMNHKNENSLLLHSKFLKKDRDNLFDKVYQNFCYGGTKKYDVVRSGPIIQASLNISCSAMISEFTTAENFLQRLGRLDRFGESTAENIYIYAAPEGILKGGQKSRCARFLNSQNCFGSAVRWYQFIKNRITNKSVTIKELYEIYNEFYQDKSSNEIIQEDLLMSFNTGIELINTKILDPVSFPETKKVKIKIKKYSLRGENRFVQMAVCSAASLQSIEYKNDYAVSEEDNADFLTAPMHVICGNGDSRKNLLTFMAKKHHNIKGTKKSYNDNSLLNNARKQTEPIYLSYTPEDLNKINSAPHPNSIYYVMSDTQPVGYLDISKISGKGD